MVAEICAMLVASFVCVRSSSATRGFIGICAGWVAGWVKSFAEAFVSSVLGQNLQPPHPPLPTTGSGSTASLPSSSRVS